MLRNTACKAQHNTEQHDISAALHTPCHVTLHTKAPQHGPRPIDQAMGLSAADQQPVFHHAAVHGLHVKTWSRPDQSQIRQPDISATWSNIAQRSMARIKLMPFCAHLFTKQSTNVRPPLLSCQSIECKAASFFDAEHECKTAESSIRATTPLVISTPLFSIGKISLTPLLTSAPQDDASSSCRCAATSTRSRHSWLGLCFSNTPLPTASTGTPPTTNPMLTKPAARPTLSLTPP